MKPVLFDFTLGGKEISLSTYGLFVAVGFAAGIVLAARAARRRGLDPDGVLDLSFWLLVAGVLGSRLFFVALNAGDYWRVCRGSGAARSMGRTLADCAAPLRVWEGGLVFYGGALAAAGAALLFCRRRGWRFGEVADLFAPGLALGHAIGRMGCFFAGCCFGRPTGVAWGAAFPAGSVAHGDLLARGLIAPDAARTPPLHPTQLYESLGEIVVFFLLVFLQRRSAIVRPGGQRAHGLVALAYAGCYGLLRFTVDVFRGDDARGFVVRLHTPELAASLGFDRQASLFLSLAQAVSLLVAAGALVLAVRARPWVREGAQPHGSG